jgi:hypothetical protein
MRNTVKIFAGLSLALFITNSYAIDVSVHSTSSGIFALGYTANGSSHGGLGKSYNGTGMPVGAYVFGIRAHGKDVSCLLKNGQKTIQLKSNTAATVVYDGVDKCTLTLAPK